MKQPVTIKFFELLLTLLKGKTCLSDALKILSREGIDNNVKNIAETLLKTMKKGKGFSESVREINGENFRLEPLYHKLISAGEMTGNIETVLEKILADLRNKKEAKNRLKNILIYPLLIVLLAVAGSVLLILFGIPFLADAGILSEAVIVEAVYGIIAAGTVLFLGGTGLLTVYWRIFGNDSPEYRIFYLLDLLLQNNFTLTEALWQCINCVKETKYSRMLVNAKNEIAAGKTFSAALSKNECLDSHILGWLSLADKQGNLNDICPGIRDYYSQKDGRLREAVSRLAEPAVIILTGIYVFVIVFTVIMPFLTFTGGIL